MRRKDLQMFLTVAVSLVIGLAFIVAAAIIRIS